MQVKNQSTIQRTPRVQKIEGYMDLAEAKDEQHIYEFELPNIKTWNIGIIVGPSGADKSTVLNEILKNYSQVPVNLDNEQPLIDWLDKGTVEERIDALNSVGLGSVVLWRRNYNLLSNGERHRADLAYALLHNEIIVFDEFTSVIDRPQAISIAVAISKTMKRTNKKIILASCHYDILEWLEPDWIYEPHKNLLTTELLRRPKIKLDVYKTDLDNWRIFAPYHYMNASHQKNNHRYIALWNEEPIAWISMRHFPHPRTKNIMKVHRLVVRPEYQGLGVGMKLLESMKDLYKDKRIRITTTHPLLIKIMKKSDKWALVSNGSSGKNNKNEKLQTTSRNFLMKTFQMK